LFFFYIAGIISLTELMYLGMALPTSFSANNNLTVFRTMN